MSGKSRGKNTPYNAVVVSDDRFSAEKINSLISKVREMGINRSKDEIVKVLEHCNYNVDATVTDFYDGAHILSDWQFKSKKSKKKKFSKPKSSQESSGNEQRESETGSCSSSTSNLNGHSHNVHNGVNGHTNLDTTTPQESNKDSNGCIENIIESLNGLTTTEQNAQIEVKQNTSTAFKTEQIERTLPQHEKSSEKISCAFVDDKTTGEMHRTKSFTNGINSSSKGNSSTSSRVSDVTESTRGSTSGTKTLVKKDVERTISDLKRQSSALARVDTNLKSEIEQSYSRIRAVFADIRARIQSREEELKKQMESVEIEANDLLVMRKKSLQACQQQAERSANMPVEEFKVLRQDVKVLIGDRNLDQDLGSFKWFQYFKVNLDDIVKSIQEFGEVLPVKNKYSQKGILSTSSTGSFQIDVEASSSGETPVASSPSSVASSLSGISSTATEMSRSGAPSETDVIPSFTGRDVNTNQTPQNVEHTGYRSHFRGGGGPRSSPNYRRDRDYFNRGQGSRYHSRGRGNRRGSWSSRPNYRRNENPENTPHKPLNEE